MKDHSKEFWEKMQVRLSNELPQAYTEDKWTEMDALLNNKGNAKSDNKNKWFFFMMSFLLFALLFFGVKAISPQILSPTKQLSKETLDGTGTEKIESFTNEAASLNHSDDKEKQLKEKSTKEIKQDNNFVVASNQQGDKMLSQDNAKKHSSKVNKQSQLAEVLSDSNQNGNIQLVTNEQINFGTSDTMLMKGHLENQGITKRESLADAISTVVDSEDTKNETGVIDEAETTIYEIISLPSLELPALAPKEEESEKPLPIIKPVRKKIGFGLMAGLNVGFPEAQKKSILPTGGIYAFYPISKRWTIQLEANYKEVNNYNQKYTLRDSIYNISGTLNVNWRSFEFSSLSMAEVSLIAKYSKSKRLSYFLGGRISRIWLDVGRESGLVTNPLVPLTRIPEIDPFWKTSYASIIGVEIKVTPRLSVDVRYNQGLIDITPDNLYEKRENHLNSDVQFLIRYRLK